jgi:hypothetical protein
MTAKRTAMEYADSVLALVPQLIHRSIEERRKHACWYAIYRRERLDTCHPIMRPMWRALWRRSKAMCTANRAMADACVLAEVSLRTVRI